MGHIHGFACDALVTPPMPDLIANAAPAQRPWREALLWLLLLGPFFFATYGLANWLASNRPEVGAVVFSWERDIPFLSWTIVPYWSIDVLYGLSLFVCATREELRAHVRRLLAAQVIAVSCFLAFPLKFVFARPETEGLFGWMFEVLMGFDRPFNQAPSLHVALLVILWVLYGKYATGAWRLLLHGWFALIAVSILTTYQHHFIDLPTGLWVGWLCVWLFPEQGRSPLATFAVTAVPVRRKIAFRYGVAGLLLGIAAFLGGGWMLWLLWPASALALVAAIYACLNETAFQKNPDGSLSGAAWWLLAPYVAGAWINSRWWTRSMPRADAVAPGLLLGRFPTRREREALGVRSMVDLTAELPCDARGASYRLVPQLDLVTPSQQQLERAAEAIEASMSRTPVLVCCALGFSRSALAVAAWLLRTGRAGSAAEAIAQIRSARPAVVLHADHVQQMAEFERLAR
jgi:protein-tyrosine phosphatase